MKLFESDKTYAFLDINPLSRGHAVRIDPSQLA
jgi:diadenosine tetraphosphate (Ap4A) HIT family hydrolase